MKLPSIQNLWQGIAKVILRFPLQFFLAIVSTVVCWYLINPIKNNHVEENLGKLLAICNLALTLSLASDLFCEVHQKSNTAKWLLRGLTILICAGLYHLLDPWSYQSDVFRIGLLAFAFHLLVAFAPFIGNKDLNGFWEFNKSLFIRLFTSAFYAAVLFAGLALALFAIDGLFTADIGYKSYLNLLSLVGVTFTTIFFLAGIPDTFDGLDHEKTYPKGLKIFTQYVLIPLMTIYLAILLVYEIKIIIQWTLPNGLVSTLILGYAVFGILSLLLIYPIKEQEGNNWIKLFSKFFYLMMIPLVILLLLAIGKRVGDYGITESRYILLVLAIWLAFITGYFLWSKKQNIKIIPISLCIIAILATYGPQSAFSVSKFSQISRLKKLIKSTDKKEIEERPSVLKYLVERHGLTSLQSFTKIDLDELNEKLGSNSDKNVGSRYIIQQVKIDTAFAILKVKRFQDLTISQVRFENENNGLILIGDYDAMLRVKEYEGDSLKQFNGTTFQVARGTDVDPNKITITIGKTETFDFDLKPVIDEAYKLFKADQLSKGGYEQIITPSKKMELVYQAKSYRLKLVINNINVSVDNNNKAVNYFDFEGYLLIKKN